LIGGLTARGHDNLLLCPGGSRAEAVARQRGIAVRTVPMRGGLDLAAVWRLARRFAEAEVDLVHLHTGRAAWLGGLAARLAGRSAIVTGRMERPVRRGWGTRWTYQRRGRRGGGTARGGAGGPGAG